MPDSDYNRDIGIFQLSAELESTRGDLMAKTSYPCMLRFNSWPVRAVIKHKEGAYLRSGEVKISLIPRAGTYFLPQFYKAGILVESRMSWMKHLVYMWKWTFYVWTTFYVYVMLAGLVVLFFKPLFVFPSMFMVAAVSTDNNGSVVDERLLLDRVDRESTVRRRSWQPSRIRRKSGEEAGSSISFRSYEEGSGDSGSVCS